MAYNGVMNMRNLILFLLMTVTANAQTIKDGSIVARMISNDLITHTGSGIGYSLVTSVNSNAFTVTLKSHDNASLSALKPAVFFIRDSDGTTGKTLHYKQSSDLSITIPSGTTLGTTNGVQGRFWVYILNNSGTLELALTHGSVFDCAGLATTSAISGGATVGQIYSTTARTDKPCALIGYFEATEATAGTWVTNASIVLTRNFSTFVSPTRVRYTSGSGTYTVSKNAKYISVTACGGGAGGFGSGSAAGTSPTAGGNTTFDSFVTSGGGGVGSFVSGVGGAGGGCVVNSPAINFLSTAGGDGGPQSGNGTQLWAGGNGGVSILAGNGRGGANSTGEPASTNSGSGGGGGGISGVSGGYTGSGGGAGCCSIFKIFNLASSYSYSVGAGGNAGGAGTSGKTGGAGVSGVIVIEEFYQ